MNNSIDTKGKETKLFNDPKALGCNILSAAKVLLGA